MLIGTGGTIKADLLIEGEKIVATGQEMDVPDAEIIDASGKFVMPISSLKIIPHSRNPSMPGTKRLT